MAFVIADRVKETTTTAGNGTVTLLGASAGYQSFAAVGNGNTTYYCIAGQTTSEWEVGIGTYTSSGTTLSRDTVLSSSNSGNKVVFSAGTKDVFVTYPSQRAVTTDTTQTLTNKTLSSGSDWNGNAVAVTYGGTGTTTFSSNIIPYFDGSTFNSTNVYFFSNLVGVNISSPGAQLDVQASTGTPLRFATAYADVSAVWGQRIGSSTTEKYRISWDYLNGGFYFYDISNSAERMRIDSSGNVGIGTNAPAVKLNVNGNQINYGTNPYIALSNVYNDTPSYIQYNTSTYEMKMLSTGAGNAGFLTFATGNGNERLRIDSSGNVGIGTSSVVSSARLQVTASDDTYVVIKSDGSGDYSLSLGSGGTPLIARGSGAPLAFGTVTNGTAITSWSEQMRIDSSGNVGIGTSSPSNRLHVKQSADNSAAGLGARIERSGNDSILLIGYRDNTDTWQYNATYTSTGAFKPLTFHTSDAERMRIDTSGNVGIGTSSPVLFGVSGRSLSLVAPSGNYAFFQLQGGSSVVGGAIDFGNDTVRHAEIASLSGSDLAFYTNATNSGNTLTERMRITSSGNVGIGTSAPGQKFVVSGGRTNLFANSETYALGVGYSSSVGLYYIGATNSATPDLVFSQVGGSERARITNAGGFSVGTTADPGAGAIYATGNITAYYSDDRLKTRLGKIENALDKVDQLNGFYYEANETAQELGYAVKREVGVSAQDVQAVLPEIVVPAPIDEKYLTIHYERLVPLLIEAIKELRAEVKALKEK